MSRPSAAAPRRTTSTGVATDIGDLTGGQSHEYAATLQAAATGRYDNTVHAAAANGLKAQAAAQTAVQGIPAVLLEVVDLTDPIRVGEQVTYVIQVTNQGSAPDSKIGLTCELGDAMQYASSEGPTNGQLQGNKVVFTPLARLDPQAKATWRVTVKAAKTGDVRFKTTMTTTELQRPVEETESTRFYEFR